MSLRKHFKLADDIITHLNTVVRSIPDPFIGSRYTGLVSIAAVTVYELCIKEIFCEFSQKKDKAFGIFVENYFKRISGRIKYQIICEDYLKKFGDKYYKKFKERSNSAEEICLRDYGNSIFNSYNNIIEWRNQFAHEGTIPTTATYEEVTKSYEIGKNIVIILKEIMKV
jgi:hypothetical protein